MAVDPSTIAAPDTAPGEPPSSTAAWAIPEERFGEPVDGTRLEEVEVPEPGAFEVLVRVPGAAPEIVLEHVGRATFPTGVYTARPFGKGVICAGTTGSNLDVDARHLEMQEIRGSHVANAYECLKADELIESGAARPVLWRTPGFDGVGEAHQLMKDTHVAIAILVGAQEPGRSRTAAGPGAIHAEVDA